MQNARKRQGKATSMASGLTFGATVSMGITVIGSAVLAKLLDLEKMTWENMGYGILIMLLIGSFLGSTIAICQIKRRRLLVCFAAGGIYWLLLLGIATFFFGGHYHGVMVACALILSGSLSAGLMVKQSNRRVKHGKRRVAHC